MNIDIRTLAFIMGLTGILQVIAIYLQYLLNKTYQGIGWWLLWSASTAAGLLSLLLRDILPVGLISASIFLSNILLLAGQIFLYIGIMRFLDKKENRGIIIAVFAVFMLSTFYVLYVNRDDNARALILYTAAAIFAFLAAQGLFVNKTRSFTVSANFISAVLFAYGCYFALRAIAAITVSHIDSVFTPTLIQIATFLVMLTTGFLCTLGLIIMVSQRSNAEMKEAKEQFELIFNTGPDATLITRPKDGLIVNINEGFTALTGYTRDETVGKSSLAINLWKDPADRQNVVNELGKKGFCDNYEAFFQLKDGSQIDGTMSAKIITLQGVQHIISVTRDITAPKRAEEALRDSNEKFSKAFLTSPDSIAITRLKDGVCVAVNKSFTRIMGYEEGEIVGKSILALNIWANPADRQRMVELLKAEGAVESFEALFITKTGTLLYGLMSAAIIELSGESHIINTTKDITEYVQAQKTLRESEEKYRTLVEKANEAIVIVQDAVFVFANRKMTDLLGVPDGHLIGKPFIDFIWPEDRELVRTNYSKRIAGETVRDTYDFRFITARGKPVWVFLSAAVIQWKEKPATLNLLTDITERKQAEGALRQEHIMLARTENIANIGSWEWDIATDTVTWSDELFRIFQLAPKEGAPSFAGQPAFYHPDDFALLRQAVEVTVADGTPYTLEIRAIRKDGETRVCIARGVAEMGADGRPNRLFGSLQDITERRHVEKTLWESEELYHSLFENMLNGFAYCKMIFEQGQPRDFTYLAVNTAFEKHTGLRDVTGKKVSEIIPGIYETDPQLIEIYGRVSLTGKPETFETYLAALKMWFSISVYSPQNEYFVAIFDVITERKQSEELLRQSEERYRTISRLSSEFAYSCVHSGTDGYEVDWITNAFYTVTGYSEAELHEQGCWLFVSHPDDQEAAKATMQGLRAGESATQELRIVSRDGRVLNIINYMECHSDPKASGGLRLFGAVQDITYRKKLNEERQRVEKLESVGLLAGGIAHDFNNILTAILGNISLASIEAAPGSDLRNSLEQAEKASLRAKDLTVQLLTFSKGGAPVKKLASLADLIRDTASFALGGSKVKCQFSIPLDLWQAEIDAGQVSQVIHNLVINAKQAMPTGGTIELRAENIELRKTQNLGKGLPLKEGDYVRIAVADHGTGIPKDHLEKIFDPFFSTKQEGSGLGLATSFSIARQHGGHLSVESELGAGSTFYLYLAASMKTVTLKKDKKAAIKPIGNVRILVMDDESGIRGIADRLLKHIGYKNIEFAADGAEAIKLYKAAMETGNPFSVVILDLTIPGGIGGEETIKKLIKIDPGVKAIVSSGYIDDKVIAKYREYGFSGMVAKPYTIAELRKAVQDVIG